VVRSEQPLTQQALQYAAHTRPVHQLQDEQVRTATRGDGDLYGVAAGLTDLLEVQRLMGSLVLPTVDAERRRVDRHLHAGRPVGVHLPILVVETLELQLQVRPPHESLVHRGLELEDMVADS